MFTLTSYFSVEYLCLLLPLCVLVYAILPKPGRRVTLLFFSYFFFWAFSGWRIIFLLISTVSVYFTALWIGAVQDECDKKSKEVPREDRKALKAGYASKKKRILVLAVLINLSILIVLKYSFFLSENINAVFRILHCPAQISVPVFILPIGISFYTLQAISYVMDVYYQKIGADHNFPRVALFLSFFPQIMEGPICRYSQTALSLWDVPGVNSRDMVMGIERILYGLLKKTVVADRLNLMIETVFDGYAEYDGLILALGVVCYTVQLYMDFSGTMDVVAGTAQIFSVKMPENFRRPFFSKTISEFWTRWHITLGAWFRDYLFYPLSMSKPLKNLTRRSRKKLGNHYGPLLSGAIALFAVWMCNGLWHGAGWHYIVFGLYHFVLILTGSLLEPPTAWLAEKMHIRRSSLWYRCLQTIRTVFLVCIGELFFRASSLSIAFTMLRRILTTFTFASVSDRTVFSLGADAADFLITLLTLVLIFVIGVIQEKGIKIRETIASKNIVLRIVVIYALIIFIVLFGAYGKGYIPVDPMYAEF